MSVLWIVLLALPILGGAERFNCRGRILGAYYADAKSGCKAFHVCVRVAGGGIRDFRFFCPPGTLFHQEAQTCTDWGDDDPLACPADLYDGQFDLYKIGSGFDTKKVSSSGNRDEEAEFGLQRAETGDRRISQNNGASNNGVASDLRTAHSSDFFSGQRERGRDDFAPPAPSARPQSPPRQSFRRASTPRAPSTTTQYTTPSAPPQPSSQPTYDVSPKRKLVRKRPIYASTSTPTTTYSTPAPSFPPYAPQPQQSSFGHQQQQQQSFRQETQPAFPQPQQSFNDRAHFQNRASTTSTVVPPANVPPQYKDEYVEVVRVAPKQNKNRYFPNRLQPTPAPFTQSTASQNFNKKNGLVELYNYEAQSTPGLNAPTDNKPFKVKNSFNVADSPREQDFVRININSNNERISTTTVDYNTAASRGFTTSTPSYKSFNSVSYEPEKNNIVQFNGNKQNFFNNPTTTQPTTIIYTTSRTNTPANLNTVAYNTNNALNTEPRANFADTDDDDGQYRPPEGEDDGQYRPELYERELLSGAHSLNIAASGNRLPEDQKSQGKAQIQHKPVVSQTAAPRPFRPAPTTTLPTTQTTRAPESTTYEYTTYRPSTTFGTQRTFDYFQTYTTTVRPIEQSVQGSFSFANNANKVQARPTTTLAPRAPELRPQSRAPAPPTVAPTQRPTTRPPHFANPPSNKEDASYDYAYYDSDNGFSQYDHIEEFEKTKQKKRA